MDYEKKNTPMKTHTSRRPRRLSMILAATGLATLLATSKPT